MNGWVSRLPASAHLAGRALVLFAVFAAPALAAGTPAKKDTSARLRPKEATFTTTVTPATAKPGDVVTYSVTAKLAPHWHIYRTVKVQAPTGNAPIGTQFDFFDKGDLQVEGDWEATTEAVKKKEPAFPDLPFVEFYEDTVTWAVKLRVPKTARPGDATLRSQIYFQICDPKSCKPPARVTVPDAKVTIQSAAAAVADPTKVGPAALAVLTVAYQAAPEAAPAAKPAPAAAPKEIQDQIDRGLIPFLLFAALNGLLALLMPCVWPMLPITVNFFVKQGQSKSGNPVALAFVYALSIIGIFTLVGLFFSVAFGAKSTTALGNNAWLNLAFGLVFIAFGLSLLGLFEIRLPSSLLNLSSSNESRGGLVGVMFMALTLTITSFTCTAPLVGSLLVMASRGQYFYPVLGLLVFSAFLALPFLLLALFPSRLSTMPRSGDWMNTVKVVGGLLEIGAAFKFLNTAEVSFRRGPENVWIDTPVILSVWVVLAFVCGIYLLGLFRTDHDHDEIRVGPGRMLIGSLFLALALYLAPALFGLPPKSKFFETIAGILPPDAGKLNLKDAIVQAIPAPVASPVAVASRGDGDGSAAWTGTSDDTREVKATSSKPDEALRQERKLHGLSWGLSYEAAVERARREKRPILIDFTGVNCPNCRTAERTIFPRPEVVAEMKNFVRVALYTDFVDIATLSEADRESLAEANLEREVDMTGQTTSPQYVVVTPDGKSVVANRGYDPDPAAFARFLKDARAKVEKQAVKVADAR